MSPPRVVFLLMLPFILASAVAATVPLNGTFTYVNDGPFGEYNMEYHATYRPVLLGTHPYQFCFYNTTNNAYTFALRLGTISADSIFLWVWEANRGRPVGDKATITFGTDGNLVLAEANGRVVWQTNTANKGVVAFDVLANGNVVLLNAKRGIVWQSFDYPTDTLMVGQSLKTGTATKLVSRASRVVNADGAYSAVMEPTRFALYYTSPSTPQPYLYFSSESYFTANWPLRHVTLESSKDPDKASTYHLSLNYQQGQIRFATRLYDLVYSFLRLGIDGNVRAFTFNDNVDEGAWNTTFVLFSKAATLESYCQLPGTCGSYGLCENSRCVACPSGGSLLSWNATCSPPKISCGSFGYFELKGVDHFLCKYTAGETMSQSACAAKCSRDCKCKGYFYHTDTSRCWTANVLMTMTKVANSAHLAFIKSSK